MNPIHLRCPNGLCQEITLDESKPYLRAGLTVKEIGLSKTWFYGPAFSPIAIHALMTLGIIRVWARCAEKMIARFFLGG